MKNLLVITLIFLVGCSQNFKYVLDCEMSKITRTDVVKTEEKATIKFNNTKVGSSVFYNLVELKFIESPYKDSLFSFLYAERIFNNGENRHLLQIVPNSLYIDSFYYFLNKDNEWKQTTNYLSDCKLR